MLAISLHHVRSAHSGFVAPCTLAPEPAATRLVGKGRHDTHTVLRVTRFFGARVLVVADHRSTGAHSLLAQIVVSAFRAVIAPVVIVHGDASVRVLAPLIRALVVVAAIHLLPAYAGTVLTHVAFTAHAPVVARHIAETGVLTPDLRVARVLGTVVLIVAGHRNSDALSALAGVVRLARVLRRAVLPVFENLEHTLARVHIARVVGTRILIVTLYLDPGTLSVLAVVVRGAPVAIVAIAFDRLELAAFAQIAGILCARILVIAVGIRFALNADSFADLVMCVSPNVHGGIGCRVLPNVRCRVLPNVRCRIRNSVLHDVLAGIRLLCFDGFATTASPQRGCNKCKAHK